MPGETVDDALDAAAALRTEGFPTILTYLGENITSEAEATAVVGQYALAQRTIVERGLDCHLSVKLTQLGIDLSEELCAANLSIIVRSAEAVRNFVWIDMEGTPYVDRTLNVFRALRQRHTNVGLCLQSYLYRTQKDLEQLAALKPMIRLVKGAYSEPPDLAFPEKKDVDRNYVAIAKSILAVGPQHGIRQGIGTHDGAIVKELREYAAAAGVQADGYEFEMLYGIQAGEQRRLLSEGCNVRVLISYGTFWFPWYMRRLAERPANVWFVLKSLFT
jgi:proline dehydrogenase